MAGTYDTEEQRIIDRIKCIAFREARDAGATFINRHWVAKKVHRSVQFVTDWWEKLIKSETHISDRLCLCDWLKDWTEEDFLDLAPADEFFVQVVRRPNDRNDRIWAKSVDDIEEDERYREMVRNQACIGIFVIFMLRGYIG